MDIRTCVTVWDNLSHVHKLNYFYELSRVAYEDSLYENSCDFILFFVTK